MEDDDKFGFIVMDGNGSLYGTLAGNTREVRIDWTMLGDDGPFAIAWTDIVGPASLPLLNVCHFCLIELWGHPLGPAQVWCRSAKEARPWWTIGSTFRASPS